MRIKNTFITFAGSVATKRKVEKDVKVKGFVRKGRFVRSFQRKQDVNDKTELAKKVAVGSLVTLGGILGVSLAAAAVVKLRYNTNLVGIGKKLKAGKIEGNMPKGAVIKGVEVSEVSKHYVSPITLAPDQKSMVFTIGGLGKEGSFQGADLSSTVRGAFRGTKVAKEHTFIPMFNKVQFKTTTSPIPNTREMVKDIENTFKRVVKDGENEDSILMAKEIFQWHKLNPTKPINIITHSAGGFQGRDIPHILKSAGVDTKLIKVYSTGTPDYGIVDSIIPTKNIMNVDDLYNTKVPSLNRNTTWIRSSVAEPETNLYVKQSKEMIKKKQEAELLKPVAEREKYIWKENVVAHLSSAYYSKGSPSSRRNIEELKGFMFS